MHLFKIVCLLVIFALSGCAGWSPNYEKPQFNITSFSLAPESEGLTPKFIIGIQIINPNRVALPLKGMSYSVELENNRVLSGATANLPLIAGYSMADFTIEATPDLLGSVRLMNRLLMDQTSPVDYLFKAKLDVGSLMPFINIEESGKLAISNSQQQ